MKNIEIKKYTNKARPAYKYRVFFDDGSKKAYRVFKSLTPAKEFVELLKTGNKNIVFKSTFNETLKNNIASKTSLSKLKAIETILTEYNTTLEEMLSFYVSHVKRASKNISINKAISLYIKYLDQSDFSQAHKKSILGFIYRFENAFYKQNIQELTTEKIKDWLDNMKVNKNINDNKSINSNESLSPSSYNDYRKYLSTFFNWCVKNKITSENPIDNIATKKQINQDIQIYTNSQVKEMFEKVKDKELKTYLSFAFYTGIRKDELFRLRYEDINIENSDIILSASIAKTKQRRIVKMPDNLMRYINRENIVNNKTGLIFSKVLRQRLRRFYKKLSFNWIKNGIRHTSASNYLALTDDENKTARQMGHSVNILKKHYAGLIRHKEAIDFYNIEL